MTMREQVERELFAEQARTEYDPSYLARPENRLVIERREWEILKEFQKGERLAFMDQGKRVYTALSRAVYREVREEFRSQWAEYYAAKRDGLDFTLLAGIRTGLIARQKAVLEERREPIMAELRAERDREYRALLDAQKEQRGELIDRQDRGLSSPQLLDKAYPAQKRPPERASEEARIAAMLDRFGIRRGRVETGEGRGAGKRDRERSKPKLMRGSADFASFNPSRDIGSAVAGGLHQRQHLCAAAVTCIPPS